MNFSSILKSVTSDSTTKEEDDNSKSKSSSSELLGSAKVLSDAASSAYRQETDKIDKAKVADAAGDVLSAVSDHAKLQNTSIGQYVDKAEDYLHSYGKPSTTTTAAPAAAAPPAAPAAHAAAPAAHAAAPAVAHAAASTEPTAATTEPTAAAPAAEDEPKSGAGQYLKVAEGFFKY